MKFIGIDLHTNCFTVLRVPEVAVGSLRPEAIWVDEAESGIR